MKKNHHSPVSVPDLGTRKGVPKDSRSAQEVRASEVRYRRLFEAARDGILMLDPGTRKITDANPFMVELLDYGREELLGKELWQIGLLQDERANRQAFLELQEKYYVRYENLPLRSRSGRSHEVEFVSNLYEENGRQVIQCNIRDTTEHKRVRQKLSLLDACIANLNDIVMIAEGDTLDEPGPRILFVNAAFERVTGYTCAEAVGRSPRFLQGANTDRRVLAEIRQALENGQPIRRQILNYRKDGTEICLDIDIVPIFDLTGRRTHFAAVERDVSEQKKTEEQLLWKTALFEAQVNSALDGILVVDQASKRVLQNQQMSELWQVPKSLIDNSDYTRELAWITKQNKNPRQFAEKVAYLLSHPDEVSRDEIELINGRVFDRYSAPVLDKGGKHYGRIWTFRDITERKRDEEKIAEQAAFLDKAQDAILVRGLEGKILFWSKGAERMYGWIGAEVMGLNVGALLYADPSREDEVNDLTLINGEWSGELDHLTKDGAEIIIESRWTLIRDQDGYPKSMLVINSDITEKKKIEAQFMRAQRMESIGTLAGGIAHDLNNILAPIMMSIDILKARPNGPDTDNLLQIIGVSAKRGADIVRQVLSYARGVAGERIPIQPRQLLAELEDIIKETFPKDIRLQFSAEERMPSFFGNPTQLHQVLLNLCVNARDAMPDGGDLLVRIENYVLDEHYAATNIQAKAGRYIKIGVTDSGSGIPPDLLEKIFEPFYTTKEVDKGTGLGLSTVMGIAKSHNAIINVYSEPGQGTTFNVYLPALESSGFEPLDTPPPESLPHGHGETILVVDDEAAILDITTRTLQAFGYKILCAANGAEGVAMYGKHQAEVALVLTDMMMPVMDGAGMINVLMSGNPAIRIVAASGLNANSSVAKACGAGVKHFLTKPYSLGTLLQTVRMILDEA